MLRDSNGLLRGRTKKLIHRLNRMEGQIREIRGMVENNTAMGLLQLLLTVIIMVINAVKKMMISKESTERTEPLCASFTYVIPTLLPLYSNSLEAVSLEIGRL